MNIPIFANRIRQQLNYVPNQHIVNCNGFAVLETAVKIELLQAIITKAWQRFFILELINSSFISSSGTRNSTHRLKSPPIGRTLDLKVSIVLFRSGLPVELYLSTL